MRSLLIAGYFFGLVFAAFAQSDRGTITGTVADPGGAVVAGAAIEARNTATGAVYPVASSATGNYTIAQLPAGAYDLTVTVAGFKKFIRAGLTVEVAGTLRVDAALEVGAANESVTVTEAATLLKTEGGEVSANIATQTLDDLPILTLAGSPNPNSNPSGLGNIRNPLASVTLLPACLPVPNPSIWRDRIPPMVSIKREPRLTRRAWKRSRRWPSRPVISPPSMARPVVDISTTP
jgi:hypothetical protein